MSVAEITNSIMTAVKDTKDPAVAKAQISWYLAHYRGEVIEECIDACREVHDIIREEVNKFPLALRLKLFLQWLRGFKFLILGSYEITIKCVCLGLKALALEQDN